MKKFLNFKNLRHFFLYITPVFPDSSTNRYKLGIFRILLFFIIFSGIVGLVVFLVILFTPAKEAILYFTDRDYRIQKEKIEELKSRVVFLTKELESISSINKKLKYAIFLGDSNLVDTLTVFEPDSLSIQENSGSSIYHIFKKIFFSQEKDNNSVFFIHPVSGVIVKKINLPEGHYGVDYAVKNGTSISATASGYIIFSDYTINDGNMIMILHQDNYISIYKHCLILLKQNREYVKQGDVIALSGNSGHNTTGSHLHFEIWKNGKVIDPEKVIINSGGLVGSNTR